MVQLPSDTLLRELGQASLTVTLVGSPVASRVASQAPHFMRGCLTVSLFIIVGPLLVAARLPGGHASAFDLAPLHLMSHPVDRPLSR